MRDNDGKKLRKFFTKKDPLLLLDLGPGIFASATVDTNILILRNRRPRSHDLRALPLKDASQIDFLYQNPMTRMTDLSEESWIILTPEEMAIKEKIERIGTPLKDWDINIYRGVLTGYNEAFIIDGAKRKELIEEDPKSAEIIKPLLRGRDIKRYKAEFADLWLIATFPSKNIDINEYPAIKRYLEEFLPRIEQTGRKFINEHGKEEKTRKRTNHKWYETQDAINYWNEFEKEKIVWKRIGSVIRFSYEEKNSFCLDSTVILTGKNIKFLNALLNSNLMIRELLLNSPKTGTGDVIISVQALEPLLAAKPPKNIIRIFDSFIDSSFGSPFREYI